MPEKFAANVFSHRGALLLYLTGIDGSQVLGMIFKQFYLNCLAHASYLIGDGPARTAVVVDPRRDVQQYLDEADRHGLVIRHVFLTHFHADFIAGHLELRDKTGASIHLGAKARAEYAFTPMKGGETLEFGRVRLEVLETPGHTAESISILVYDLEKMSRRPVRRTDRRHLIHRRRRPPGFACVSGMVGNGSRPTPLSIHSRAAAAAAR